jgi:hypothetical protein
MMSGEEWMMNGEKWMMSGDPGRRRAEDMFVHSLRKQSRPHQIPHNYNSQTADDDDKEDDETCTAPQLPSRMSWRMPRFCPKPVQSSLHHRRGQQGIQRQHPNGWRRRIQMK